MLAQAKILSADVVDHIKKGTGEVQKKCEVALQFSQPTEVHICTIWNDSVNKGEHHLYQQLVGKTALVAVRHELYQGKQQVSLVTSVQPVELVSSAKVANK